MSKPDIVVIYHSAFGHTKKQAEAVHRGAAELGNSTLMEVAKIDWKKLDEADAIIFGAPTYMGSVSYQFKKFMDESGTRWLKSTWKDKIAGGFTNSGAADGDKHSALSQLVVFAAQHVMIWVGAEQGEDGDDINRHGSSLGATAQSADDSPEITPPQSDLKTAEIYGKRIAAVTIKFKSR